MSEITLAQVDQRLKRRIKKMEGSDTAGNEFKSIIPLWTYIFPSLKDEKVVKKARLASEVTPGESWYGQASQYWEDEKNCPITDGDMCTDDS